MATFKTKPKKSVPKQGIKKGPTPSSHPRRLKQPKRFWYKPWTWAKRLPPPPYPKLPKARKLLRYGFSIVFKHWKLFGGIVLIYGAFNLILVRGLSGSDNLSAIKGLLDSVFSGSIGGKLLSASLSFTYLLSSSGSGNTATSGIYQGILLVICSLAFIWALRQSVSGKTVRIRDSFYGGMYPLVPFLIVLFFIGLQLMPLIIANFLYGTVVRGGIAIHLSEKIAWSIPCLILALWTLRMLTSSVFALYIVTLPEVTPLAALRSAKELVYGRRLLIWRKLIFLPVMLIIIAAIIELPLIMYVTVLAPWMFFVLSMAALVVVHAYLYALYRELLNE